MALDVNYRGDKNIVARFCDNWRFATRQELQGRNPDAGPNWCETLGNGQLWLIEKLPGKIWNGMKDPRVVTLGLTALALYAVSLGFYSQITRTLTNKVIQLLPQISEKVVRFVLWSFLVNGIVGYHNRAQGRFWNTALTNQFWNPAARVLAPASTAPNTL